MSRFTIQSAVCLTTGKTAYYIVDGKRSTFLWHNLKLEKDACRGAFNEHSRFKSKYRQGWYKTQNSALSTIQKFEEKCMKYGLHPLNPYAPGTRDAEVWEEGSKIDAY